MSKLEDDLHAILVITQRGTHGGRRCWKARTRGCLPTWKLASRSVDSALDQFACYSFLALYQTQGHHGPPSRPRLPKYFGFGFRFCATFLIEV